MVVIRGIGKGLLALGVVAVCLAAIPLAGRLGVFILATAPNPRHPPEVMLGEAVGWAIVSLLVGAVFVFIGEAVAMPERTGLWGRYKGLIRRATLATLLAAFLGTSLAVLQMDSVDGQAITSVKLGIMAGAVVSLVGVASGIVAGVVLRRIVIALAP